MKIRKREENGEFGQFENIPGIPHLPSSEEQIMVLDERTVGMQAIDDYTLQAQATIDERTVGMQEIDDFTLQLINDQAATIAQLQADVAQLKGGV